MTNRLTAWNKAATTVSSAAKVEVTKTPGGLTWTVNGTDIPKGTNFSDLNLGVSLGTNGISAEVINKVTGKKTSIQLTLSHNGPFGFALTLTAPPGKENAGFWANLYHIDSKSHKPAPTPAPAPARPRTFGATPLPM